MDANNFRDMLNSIAHLLNIAADAAASGKNICTGSTSLKTSKTPVCDTILSDLLYDMSATLTIEAADIIID